MPGQDGGTWDRRAALWQDKDGTWWLLAAGRRKNDTAGDFYREIERYSADAAPIAPTDDDYRYQRLEAAYEQECEAERAAHAEVLGAVLSAARSPETIPTVDAFGATVSVRIVPDEEGLAVLEMSWEFAEFDQQDRFPMDVLAMVPGREGIDAWDYLPPRSNSDSPHTWSTYLTTEWVEHMATSAELDELLTNGDDWQPVNPSSDGSEHFSHLAKGSIVTLAYLTGIEITALCGASSWRIGTTSGSRCARPARRTSGCSGRSGTHRVPERPFTTVLPPGQREPGDDRQPLPRPHGPASSHVHARGGCA